LRLTIGEWKAGATSLRRDSGGRHRSSSEKVEVVECGDDFAADQDFLEISTIPKGTIIQKALPERGGDVGRS
jgi:hypothetical protein